MPSVNKNNSVILPSLAPPAKLGIPMIPRRSFPILLLALVLCLIEPCDAQSPSASDDAVRVTVSLNSDGSRTVYQFDNSKHEATATTTDEEGRARGKVVYRINDSGKFLSGVVFGPDGKFVFKTVYKYDAAGRLEEETHLTKEDAVINKVVYKYNAAGKQAGYSIFDANGKLTAGTASPSPTAPPKSHNTHGR